MTGKNDIGRGMSKVADELDLIYRHTDLSPFSALPQPPWDGPSRGVLYNRMHGTWRGHQVWVFDFEIYDTSERNTTREDLRTAICITSEAIRWPRTKIRPSKRFDRVANWLFDETAAADSAPRHIVEGDDENWPGLNSSRLKQFLQQHPDLEIRLGFGELSILRLSHCLDAYEVEDYLETAEQLLDIVSEPPGHSETCGSAPEAGQFLLRSNRARLNWLQGAILSMLLLAFCVFHLRLAHHQRAAAQFASTQGSMNHAAFGNNNPDPWIGLPEDAIRFTYVVNGRVYRGNGNNRRFVWRPFRRGDDTAKQFKKAWHQGARPTVFYDPQSPHVAVLDNSFTQGDVGFVKLLLFVSGICLTCLSWPFLRRHWQRFHATLLEQSRPVADLKVVRYPLPALTYTLETMAFVLVPLSFYTLFWIISLAIEPIGFFALVGLWLRWAIVINACAVPVVYLAEKLWIGSDGRCLVADYTTRQLSIPRSHGRMLEVPFDQIRSVRIRDTLRDFDTLSVICSSDAMLTYADKNRGRTEIMITRCLTRKLAFQLVTWINSIRDFDGRRPPTRELSSAHEFAGKPRTRLINELKVEHLSYACLALGGVLTALLVTGFVVAALVLMTVGAFAVLIIPRLVAKEAGQ